MVCCVGGGLRIQEALPNDHLSLQIHGILLVAFAQGISQDAHVAKQHMVYLLMYPEAGSHCWGGFP